MMETCLKMNNLGTLVLKEMQTTLQQLHLRRLGGFRKKPHSAPLNQPPSQIGLSDRRPSCSYLTLPQSEAKRSETKRAAG